MPSPKESGRKVYVLSNGQFESYVAGVFATPKAAMAVHPGASWLQVEEGIWTNGQRHFQHANVQEWSVTEERK